MANEQILNFKRLLNCSLNKDWMNYQLLAWVNDKKRLSESSGAAALLLYGNKVGCGPGTAATVASDELNSLFYEDEKIGAKRPRCG